MRRSNKYPGMYPKPGILSYLREQNHVTQAELAAYLSKAIDEKYDYKVQIGRASCRERVFPLV